MINRLLISLALISMFHLCMNEMIFCSSSLTPGEKGLQSQTVSRYPCKSDVCLNVFHAVFCCNRKCLSVFPKMKKKKKKITMRVNVNSLIKRKYLAAVKVSFNGISQPRPSILAPVDLSIGYE